MNAVGDWTSFNEPLAVSALILVALWSLFWEGVALWHAGRRDDLGWFVALFLINTAGILEIVYLFGFAKLKGRELFSRAV